MVYGETFTFIDFSFMFEIASTLLVAILLLFTLETKKFLWRIFLFPIVIKIVFTTYYLIFTPVTNIIYLLYIGYLQGIIHVVLIIGLIYIFKKSCKNWQCDSRFILENKTFITVFLIAWILDFILKLYLYILL
jgi:hypothetical protein